MKAAVFHGPRDIRVEEVETPKLETGDVLIRIKACGICGSDLHMYKHGLFLDLGVPMGSGRVMGHEWSGEVAETSGQVPGLKVADRVTTAYYGACAEYLRIPAMVIPAILPIPEGVSYEHAATAEPLANSVHSVGLASPVDGQTIAVIGAGIIGLGVIQVLKAQYSVRVIVVDLSQKRLAMARQLGADEVVNAAGEDPVQKMLELAREMPRIQFLDEPIGNVDTVLDWAGVSMESRGPSTLEQALRMVKMNGKVVLGAVSEKPFEMDFNRVTRKGIQILGSWAWTLDEYARALELMQSGKVDRGPLITHEFPLDRAGDAYETQLKAGEAIKVLIKP